MHSFTILFLAAVAFSAVTRWWLDLRHIRHLQAHRSRVPAEFARVVSLEAHQKAADYTTAKTRLGMVHVLLDAALVLAFTLGGGLQTLSDLWSGLIGAPTEGTFATSGDFAVGVALIASVVLITGALELPLGIYRVFVIEQRFGFNRMSLAMFVGDLVKQVLLAAALGLPLVLAVLWLMERMGEYWWLYAWAAWMSFNLLVVAIYPTLIAPLFNRFTPLAEGEMKQRVERLLARCGFRSQGLFVMDSSRRSSHGNAYFTGFGRAKRIVFFDTLISRLDAPEVEAVLAHELGHFKLRHVLKRIAWSFALSLLLLWLLGVLIREPWFFNALGVTTQSAAMALILFSMVVPQLTFPLQPLMSHYSRRHEFEADAYAAEHACAADLVRALVKLYQDNAATLTPDPVHSAFYDSHPPAALRIARLQDALHHA